MSSITVYCSTLSDEVSDWLKAYLAKVTRFCIRRSRQKATTEGAASPEQENKPQTQTSQFAMRTRPTTMYTDDSEADVGEIDSYHAYLRASLTPP